MRKCTTCNLEKDSIEFRGGRKRCKKCENKRKKPKYIFTCTECDNDYASTKANEKRKKFASTCQKCAITLCWKDEEYKKKHIEALKLAHNTKETKIKHSIASKKNFENQEYKNKTLNRLNTEDARRKAAATMRSTWNDPEKCKEMLKKMYSTRCKIVECSKGQVQVKSGYEQRLIEILDKRRMTWYYEPSVFKLEAMGKIYIPDFYIEDIDLWVEVKGYWYKDAKQKWECFLREYPEVKKCVINKQALLEIERGARIEDFIHCEERRARKSL